MSGKTGIAWTDATWNPVTGCTRVSEGCNHCYAFQLHDQRHIAWKRGRWDSAPEQYHKPFSKVQMLRDRMDDPKRWRKPRRVFVNSVSDLFHPDVPDSFILDVFQTMIEAPQHIYQILTKRPERMRDWMQKYADTCTPIWYHLPHIWLGVSVEHQAAADERIPLLLQTPAVVRFISAEPLLSNVDLTPWLTREGEYDKAEWHLSHYGSSQPLSWVIIGGESGPHARVMELEWARDLAQQCQYAGVPIFMKQLGTIQAKRLGLKDRHGSDWEAWPDELELRIREFPFQEHTA